MYIISTLCALSKRVALDLFSFPLLRTEIKMCQPPSFDSADHDSVPGPCSPSAVLGPAASASPGCFLGIQTPGPHSRPAEPESAF